MLIYKKITLFVGFIILTLLFSLPLLRSGLTYEYGIGYWGPTGHDLIWHQSLINHIKNPLQIPMPSFSGHTLANYHPFYNIFIALFHNLSSIPINILIFQIFPLVSSAFYIYLSFIIGKLLTKNNFSGYLLAVINVIASSAGFLVTLISSGKLGGESLFWSMQSASFQTNPPLILSLILLQFLIIIILKNQSHFWVIIILTILPITKAYGGIAGYLLWGIYSLASLKNSKKPIIYLFLSLLPSFIVFKFYNSTSSSLLEFNPLWFIDQMFNSPDKFYFPRLASALYNFKLDQSLKTIPIYLFGISIFLIGNYFWRLIGIVYFLKNRTSFSYNLLLSSLILFLIPMFFTQKGTAWNTIQFVYYSLFLFNILFMLTINQIRSKSKKIVLIALFIATSFLANFDNYRGSLGNPAPSAIPTTELSGLKYLQQLPKGTVLTYPYDDHLKDNYSHTPIPLYAYVTSSYIPALTHHSTLISDEMNLNNSGFNWQPTLSESLKFFKQENQFQDRGFLVNNQIDYIYLTEYQISKSNLKIDQMSLKTLFNDGHTLIYQVNR